MEMELEVEINKRAGARACDFFCDNFFVWIIFCFKKYYFNLTEMSVLFWAIVTFSQPGGGNHGFIFTSGHRWS